MLKHESVVFSGTQVEIGSRPDSHARAVRGFTRSAAASSSMVSPIR